MGELTGKIALVTGATAGIGQVTASALAGMGAHVIIAGRSEPRARQVVEEICAGGGSADYLLADFGDLEQVRRLADTVRRRYTGLHILVNNAGAYFNRRKLNADGIERTFLVNHLSAFVLTNALIDVLKACAPARIINTASGSHRYGTMDFNDLFFRRGYLGMKAYARSKMANVLFTYELARRLQGAGVTANAVDPGTVTTDIWSTPFPVIGPVFKWIIGLRGLTPEQGADTLIYLASSPQVEGVTGKYFIRRKAVRSSALSNNEDIARQLWAESERLTAMDSNH